MTEAEWLQSNDPDEMLKHLGRRVSGRKLRLFGCACYRHVPRLWANERIQLAITVTEQYADEAASNGDLSHALSLAFSAMWTLSNRMAYPTPKGATATRQATARAARNGSAERDYQASLLHDLFGNPFHRPLSLATA